MGFESPINTKVSETPNGQNLVESSSKSSFSCPGMEYRNLELGKTKKDVTDFDTSIENEKINYEQQLFDGMLERGERHLTVANLADEIRQIKDVKSLSEIFNNSEKLNIIYSFLENRGMFKMVTELQEGDNIVSFLSSNKEEVSIKKLNDNIGPSLTDQFIVERKKLLQQQFAEELIELEQDFKQGIFKLNPEISIEDFQKILPIKLQTVNQALTEWLKSKNVDLLEGELYELSCGMFENKTTDSSLGQIENNFLSVQNSIQKAHLNREGQNNDELYSMDELENKLNEIQRLQNHLKEKASITDIKGNIYQIFVNGKLNRDLIRKLRKNDLKIENNDNDNIAIKNLLSQYLKAINFIDFYRPYTLDELSTDHPKMKEIQEKKALANKIKKFVEGDTTAEFHSDEIDLLYESMSVDIKDKNFNSAEIFHQKAASFDTCTYLTFDLLDVGVDQLEDYEELINKWNDGNKDNMQKEILAAGDKITNKLREFRLKIKEIMEEATYEEAVYLVGGDELTIAVPDDQLSNELFIKIKKACNDYNGARVVTSVRRSEKSVDTSDNYHKQHQEILYNAEKGIHDSKLFEKDLGEFQQEYLKNLRLTYGENFNQNEFEIIANLNRLLNESGIKDYFVKQEPGQKVNVAVWKNLPCLPPNKPEIDMQEWRIYLKDYLDIHFEDFFKN